jgi:uncharacterized protein DUF6328
MSLERKLKIALDETRLLILGAQVLFGFQFNGIFQELFEQISDHGRVLECAALLLLMTTMGLLIAPSMRHRIAEGGQASAEMLAVATLFAGVALLPLALGLSLDLFVTLERIYGSMIGTLAAGIFLLLALLFWYAIEFVLRRNNKMQQPKAEESTTLSTQVDQLLTEARVIIPGAQALLGFQFAVTLTRAFEQLPAGVKLIHVIALLSVALAVILLMAPAALHRLAFGGEDAREFVTIGSVFVIAAPIPLAFGIALDTYVAARRSLDSDVIGISAGILSAAALFCLWYAYPLWLRGNRRQLPGPQSPSGLRQN